MACETPDKDRNNASTVAKVLVHFPVLVSYGLNVIKKLQDVDEKLDSYEFIDPRGRPFFQRLFDGEVVLKSLVAPDVGAASFYVKDLSMTQLLFIRTAKDVEKFQLDGAHSSHCVFVRACERWLNIRVCRMIETKCSSFWSCFKGAIPGRQLYDQLSKDKYQAVCMQLRGTVGGEIVRICGLVEYLRQNGHAALFRKAEKSAKDGGQGMFWLLMCNIVLPVELRESRSTTDVVSELYMEWPQLRFTKTRPPDSDIYWYVDYEKLKHLNGAARSQATWHVLKVKPSVTDFSTLDPGCVLGSCLTELKDELSRRPELSLHEKTPPVMVPRATRRDPNSSSRRETSHGPLRCSSMPAGARTQHRDKPSPSWMRDSWLKCDSVPGPYAVVDRAPQKPQQRCNSGPFRPKDDHRPRRMPSSSSQASGPLNGLPPVYRRMPGESNPPRAKTLPLEKQAVPPLPTVQRVKIRHF